MKVWILDDSHFPTGYANGAMAEQPDELCRQSVSCRTYRCSGGETLCIGKEELFHPDPFQPTQIESYIGEKEPRHFDDDRLLRLFAIPFTAQGDPGRRAKKSLAEKKYRFIRTYYGKRYFMEGTRRHMEGLCPAYNEKPRLSQKLYQYDGQRVLPCID